MRPEDVEKVLSVLSVALHPRNVLSRDHWRPMRLETVKRITRVHNEIKAEKKADVKKSAEQAAQDNQEAEKSQKGPAWHCEYYDLRNEKTGKPHDNMTIALGFLIATVESREVVGGESNEMSTFWQRAESLENRLTDSEEMLSRPRVNQIAVKSFKRQLDGVFFAANRLFGKHEGQEREKVTAAGRFAEAIKRTSKPKQQEIEDMAHIVASKKDMPAAINAESADKLVEQLEERKRADERHAEDS